MRISEQMRFQHLVPGYQELQARQLEVQRQIASGSRIHKPSDDVRGTALAQGYRAVAAELEQNLRNLDEGLAWTDTTFVGLDRSLQSIQRVRELAVQAGDGTLSANDHATMAAEVEQLLKGLVDAGNTTIRGQRLFSGARTDVPAFTATTDALGRILSVAYNGDASQRKNEVAPGETAVFGMLGSNETGGDFGVFRDTAAGVDLFQSLIDLRGFLETSNTAAISGTSLPALDDAVGHLTLGLAKLGGVQGRMQASTTANEDHLEVTSASLSKVADTDLASAATQAVALDTAYKAALAVGARVSQISLLDYIR